MHECLVFSSHSEWNFPKHSIVNMEFNVVVFHVVVFDVVFDVVAFNKRLRTLQHTCAQHSTAYIVYCDDAL